MTTPTTPELLLGILAVFAVPVCLVGAVLCVCLLKAAIEEYRRDRQPHDVGPDPLRLLTDLEAHMTAYAAAVADLYEPVTDDQTGGQPS